MLEIAGEFCVLLANFFHLIYRLRILSRVKDFIEDFLQVSLVAEWPVRFILVAENDILKDGGGDAEEHRHEFVHLRAIMTYTDNFALLVRAFQDLLHLLELLPVFPIEELVAAEGEDVFSRN